MSGFDNDVLVAKNMNFDQTSPTAHVGIINGAGKLPIGTGNSPEILGGSLTSPLGTIAIGYASPNITLDLAGGGSAIDSIAVQAGISPIVPNESGQITISGSTVASGTNPLRSNGTGPSTIVFEAQRSQALSAADVTKVGLSNFDSVFFSVDINGFVSLTSGPTVRLGVANLAIRAQSGVFTILSASGSDLSATNPGFVVLPARGSLAGQATRYTITANQTFNAATSGSSTIIGNTFGTTAGVAHADEMPFFIYAVGNDLQNSISFMISRFPGATISPSSAFIAKTGSAVASTQGSFFALGNPTVTDFDTNPCLCIGAFRMTKNSSDDWTIQTLSNGSGFGTTAYVAADGIGQFHDASEFVVSTGQYGAAASSYFKANGGTAPVFSTATIGYYISRSGKVLLTTNQTNCSGAGVGAVTAQLALPFVSNDGPVISGSGSFLNGTPTSFGTLGSVTGASNNSTFIKFNTATFSGLTNADFVAGVSANFNISLNYQAVYT